MLVLQIDVNMAFEGGFVWVFERSRDPCADPDAADSAKVVPRFFLQAYLNPEPVNPKPLNRQTLNP